MYSDPHAEDNGPAEPPAPLPDAAAIARRDRRIAELAEALEVALRERDALAEAVQARFAELAIVTTAAERARALEEEVARLRTALEAAEARRAGLRPT